MWVEIDLPMCLSVVYLYVYTLSINIDIYWASEVVLVVKNPPANARDTGFNPVRNIPWSRKW